MKLAVLPVSCNDSPRVTNLTHAWLHRMTNHVAGYFSEQSGGRELIEYRVFDWCELPVSGVQWNNWGFDAGDHVRPLISRIQEVNLDEYDHWIFVIDKADAHLGATRPSDRRYAYMGAQDLDPAIMAHEMAHMFNANHARLEAAGGVIDEYGDSFCIMGAEGGKYSYGEKMLNMAHFVGQPDWHFCVHCQSMFFDGYPNKGTCPGSSTGHRAVGYNFSIPHDTAGPGQANWRYCYNCHGMFYNGYAAKGICPSGGEHVAAGYDFILPHDTADYGQDNWRFCHRCMSLFYDGYQSKGRCAAGRDHEAADNSYNFQIPFDVPPHWLSGPGMIAPTLAACNWLTFNDQRPTRNVGELLANRPMETLVELAPLKGAPPQGYQGAPVVAFADRLVHGQRMLFAYRTREDYDQGLPTTDTLAPGWILVHLSTGEGRNTTSLRIAAMPAEAGATYYLPHAALNLTLASVDSTRNTAVLRLTSESLPPHPGQANWRFCRKCYSMFFDGYPSKGNCIAGGAHAAAGLNFVLQHDVPGDQRDWRYCLKCESLFFNAYKDSGRCTVDGHVAEGYNFHLPHDVPGPGQPDWRFCHKCQSMFFDGRSNKGVCSGGGTHSAAGFNFILPYDGGDGQPDWRFCDRCCTLFYDGYPEKSGCPAGGEHSAQGYNFHLPHGAGNGQPDWRYCRNCHAMFYDGYESKGSCSIPGHAAAGYNFVIPHDSPGPGQAQWRYCTECKDMFYDGYVSKGRCSGNRAGHVSAGYFFRVEHK